MILVIWTEQKNYKAKRKNCTPMCIYLFKSKMTQANEDPQNINSSIQRKDCRMSNEYWIRETLRISVKYILTL